MTHCQQVLEALGRERWNDRIVEYEGCWLWTGCVSPQGYARVNYGGRNLGLHRLLYETVHGKVKEELHHVCEKRNCVNPDHLEPLTRVEHLRRHGYPSLRQSWENDRARTHCKRGHELTSENTRIRTSDGYERRVCKTCDRDRDRVRRETPPLSPESAASPVEQLAALAATPLTKQQCDDAARGIVQLVIAGT